MSESSSERIALSFMASNISTGEGNDLDSGLPIANQVPGKSFSDWAVQGWKLGGDIMTPGASDHYVQPEVLQKVPPTPLNVTHDANVLPDANTRGGVATSVKVRK